MPRSALKDPMFKTFQKLIFVTRPEPTFVLASGKRSNYKFIIDNVMENEECALWIGHRMLDLHLPYRYPYPKPVDYLAGVHSGGTLVAKYMVKAMHQRGMKNIPRIIDVPVKLDDEGNLPSIRGVRGGRLPLKGKRVGVIEDITTTGGSTNRAIDHLLKEEAIIDHIKVVLERGDPLRNIFKYPASSVFHGNEVMEEGFIPVVLDPIAA